MRFLCTVFAKLLSKNHLYYLHPDNPDVGGDTVMKPTVVRDNHTRKSVNSSRAFSSARRFRYPCRSSVRRAAGRVAAHLQQFRRANDRAHRRTVRRNALPRIDAFEGSGLHRRGLAFQRVDLRDIRPAGHFFPDGFVVVHRVAEPNDRGQLDGFTQRGRCRYQAVPTGHHAEQGMILPAPFAR